MPLDGSYGYAPLAHLERPLVLKEGVDAALDLEQKVLDKALVKRSPPVNGLSCFTLRRPAFREALLASCDVRYLSMILEEAVCRVRTAALADPRRYAADRGGEPPDARHLLPKLRFFDRLCREAHDTLDIRERSVMQVGRALFDSL